LSVVRCRSNAKGGALGCALLLIGLFLCLTGIGIIIGVPLVLFGLYFGTKREGVWRCSSCKIESPRKMNWYEYGGL